MTILSSANEKIAPSKVMHYLFTKHHVYPGFQSKNLIEVAYHLFGLHAARLPTPYVTLFIRVNDFQSKALWESLYAKNNLIKIRCMRRTLHILPLDFAPIAHRATLRFRLADCLTQYKKLNVSNEHIATIKRIVVDLVKERSMSAKEIQTIAKFELGKLTDEYDKVISIVIKELWESGVLCYINDTEHWGKENRLYGYTPTIYPTLNLNELSVNEAQRKLVYHHIDKFGPVTEKDIIWWSGLSLAVVRDAITHFADQLVSVEIGSSERISYMTKSNFERINKLEDCNEPWVSLLAYEDPTLKGYYESRFCYVDPNRYDLLFNKIGESRASIVVNGKVVGIWVLNKNEKRIDWDTFERINRSLHKQIESKIEEMRRFLFS